MTVRIVLADDEALIRTGLRAIIDAEADLSVVGEASTGAEVLPLVRQHRPDIVLMDVRMPDVDGIQATRHILATVADPPRIVVVTTFDNDEYVYEALHAGACGFLLKRTPVETMLASIRLVAAGDCLLFPAAIRTMAQRWGRQGERLAPVGHPGGHAEGRSALPLTDREAEILRLMATGKSNAEIASDLYVTAETVKTHVSHLLAKLGVRDRTQAVIAAYESGFIRPG